LKLTTALKEYRFKKAEVESTVARINHLKHLIKTRNIEELYYYTKNHMKLAVQTSGNSSPVECEVFGTITERELTIKLIQEWIREDRIKIYPLQIELEQLTIALTSLTKHERFIVECRYFDRKQWMETEMSFSENFGVNLTEEALQKKLDEAMRKLNLILKPFYDKFMIRG
jgi:hypothetical protein